MLGAFLLGAWVIRHVTPEPHIPTVSEKLQAFSGDMDQFNLLFIGTSQTRSSFNPKQFDARVAKVGIKTRGFNFGLGSMKLAEAYHILRRLRTMGASNLKWVLLEPWMEVDVKPQNAKTRRVIAWHDFPSTMMAILETLYRPGEEAHRYSRVLEHLHHFGYYLSNQGRARFLLEDLFRGQPEADDVFLQRNIEGRGFNEWKGTPPAPIRHDPKFAVDMSRFHHFMDRARATPPKNDLCEDRARLLWTVLEEIEALGARPILLVPASPLGGYGYNLPPEVPAVDTIRLNDWKKFPKLFGIKYRWDPLHLNWEGARMATNHLADAFIRLIQVDSDH